MTKIHIIIFHIYLFPSSSTLYAFKRQYINATDVRVRFYFFLGRIFLKKMNDIHHAFITLMGLTYIKKM